MTKLYNRRSVNRTLLGVAAAGGSVLLGNQSATAAQTFQIGTMYSMEHIQSIMATKFAEIAKEQTGGEINVIPRAGSPFGDVYQIAKQVANGQRKLDIVYMSSDVDPRLSIGLMGGLVTNFEQATQLYGKGSKGRFIEILNSIGEEVGYKYLCCSPSGFGGIAFRRDAPKSLPSVVKYKTRIPPYKSMIARYEAFNLAPIPMPYSEVYTALQTGAVDAKGATPPQEAADSFTDVIQHYMYSRDYFEGIGGIAVNLDWFNKQPSTVQQGLVEAGEEAANFVWKDAESLDRHFMDEMKNKDINIITFSDDEYVKIKNLTQESEWPVLEAEIGKDLMNRIRDIAY